MRSLFLTTFAVTALAPAFSQVLGPVTCNINTLPPEVRANGEAELVSDLVIVCTSMGPSQSVLINIQVFLNVNLTSRIMNPMTHETEALLLIDEPHPGVPNLTNGCPYLGQVLGASGVLACASGSGNVYQARVAANNSVVWLGVPYVTGGTRTFRMSNIRANATQIGAVGPGSIQAVVTMAGPVSFTISPPVSTVAFIANGLKFLSSLGPPNTITLHFGEIFPTAFKKRIENTFAGPLTASHQDVPGTPYCTESGFTPEFSALTPGAIGSASTGTRLLAHIANIPPAVSALTVPNQVPAPAGTLVADRVVDYLPNYSGGAVLTSTGFGSVAVTPLHTADLLYEVAAAAPFVGRNGCFTLDSFDIHVIAPVPWIAPIVNGRLAPVDPTPVASPTAPVPRFVP